MDTRVKTISQIYKAYNKIGITGGPGCGKTTLAKKCKDGREIIHTDDYIDLPWKEVPYKVMEDLEPLDKFIVEGVQVPRVMRKGQELDALVLLAQTKKELTPRQYGLWKGILTILKGMTITIPTYIEEGENRFVNYTGIQEQLREKHLLQQIRSDPK